MFDSINTDISIGNRCFQPKYIEWPSVWGKVGLPC